MFGGDLSATSMVLPQELLQLGGGEGERLSPQLHQVRVLQPCVGETVLGARTGPGIATQHLLEEQRGTLGHVGVELGRIKLGNLDFGLSLVWVFVKKGQLTAKHDVG